MRWKEWLRVWLGLPAHVDDLAAIRRDMEWNTIQQYGQWRELQDSLISIAATLDTIKLRYSQRSERRIPLYPDFESSQVAMLEEFKERQNGAV